MAKRTPKAPQITIALPVATDSVIDGIMSTALVTQGRDALATITTAEQAQAAGLYLRACRTAIRAIKAKWLDIRRPINAALDDLKQQELADLQPYVDGDARVNAPLIAWQVADRARAERDAVAALADAMKAAEARRAAEAAELLAVAETTAGPQKRVLKAQARAVSAAPLVPMMSTPVAAPTKIAGVALKETWEASVLSFDELYLAVVAGKVDRAALQPNQTWLDEQANALQRELRIPGVVAHVTHSQSARKL